MNTIRPVGIPSAEAVGAPTITQVTTIRPVGIPSAEAVGHPTIVRAVTEAIQPPGATRADYLELLEVLRAIRQDSADDRAARQLEDQAPMFARLVPYIRSPEGLAFVTTLVIALLALIPPVADMLAPGTPPSVVVVVDQPTSAEVERIVEERLRELTESGGSLPAAEDAGPEGE